MIFAKNHNKYEPHNIYNFPEYSNRNSAEMFATAFCDFILESEKLKENNNDMYSYMQKLVYFQSYLMHTISFNTYLCKISIMEECSIDIVDYTTC